MKRTALILTVTDYDLSPFHGHPIPGTHPQTGDNRQTLMAPAPFRFVAPYIYTAPTGNPRPANPDNLYNALRLLYSDNPPNLYRDASRYRITLPNGEQRTQTLATLRRQALHLAYNYASQPARPTPLELARFVWGKEFPDNADCIACKLERMIPRTY